MLPGIAGIALGLAIGGFCRLFGIPVPAPHRIIGGFILIAMTLGFIAAGKVMGTP